MTCPLEPAALGKGHHVSVSHHKMIQHSHVKESKGIFQAFGDTSISVAGLSHTRRVIVGQDDSASVEFQRTLGNFAGVNGCAV